ncbi:MAG TPA: TM0106 family RecB-like putative nuclease [Candidatus Saccharimonadales bacterium]|nr:TM0106 family RecB-like putative nuclease [Candidatus Saccharimonadales bacterium]
MQLIDGQVICSATDLVGFLACEHLTNLELGAAEGAWIRPERHDPELDLIQKRGFKHEAAYLERFRGDGRTIFETAIRGARTLEELRAAESETLQAMRAGWDIIYQGTFFDGRWRGHPDFLVRAERPSDLGPWSYDIADTKLARRVKAAALLQMCVYADRLAQLQGVPPETLSVVTGDGQSHAHRLAEYAAYYRSVRDRFDAWVGAAPRPDSYPDPVEHCRVCRWYGECADRRRADDHLSRVAGITGAQTGRLVAAGMPTLTALGIAPEDATVPEINGRTLDRIRRQARLQLEQYADGVVRYELLPPDPAEPMRGLAMLPAPSPGDLFFDLESDPWAHEDGLEYLFGVLPARDAPDGYTALWGHDRAGERAAFEAFVDRVMAGLRVDPSMRVYHYGAYEPAALRRLMGRHATREDEVDELLRGDVLVDLFQVVRQGIRVSQESYSLKQVEKLYMPKRKGPITQAGFSVVEYERWIETNDPSLLDQIAAYNLDDCVSTWLLRDWLEERRIEAAPNYPAGVVPRPAIVEGAPPESLARAQAETAARVTALTAGVPAEAADRNDEQRARWLLAGLLDWHRREAKPQWWAFYQLRNAAMEDLFASSEALAGLEYLHDVEERGRSIVRRYRFDPAQEFKFKPGDEPLDAATAASAGRIDALDPLAGTIDLVRGPSRLGSHPRALIPGKPIPEDVLRDALGRFADFVLARGIDPPGPFQAARDLLLGRAPSIHGRAPGQPLASPGESALDAARRLATSLDDTCLPVQGPPGSGKTYTGARMIVEVLRSGRKVGIAATTHKSITNLIEAVCAAGEEAGIRPRILQKADDDDACDHDEVTVTGDPKSVAPALRSGAANVVAGTAWLFAREDMSDAVDVLVVDEAGQMSLANVVAMAGSTRSIVLLGDPNQLPQVSQGTHPVGAERSALEHLLGGSTTIPADRGLFLDRTRRLHPEVCSYISEVFYEGRLEPDPSTARQDIAPGGPGEPAGTGIRWLPVAHPNDAARSPAEAAVVARTIAALLGRPWTDRQGRTRPMEIEDVIVVAPYNAQVAEIVRALRVFGIEDARVGTVDRFQGQEAAATIYSTATSSAGELPRTMEFLYSGNRLNVAISRAFCLAILVSSPELLLVNCHTPEQMRLANAFCRFVEVAAEQAAGESGHRTRAGDVVTP